MQISDYLAKLRKSTNLFLTKYGQLLFLSYFNAEVEIHLLKFFILVIKYD